MIAVSAEEQTVPCIACRSQIPRGASVCKECGSFQKGWKNALRYWAGVAALGFVSIAIITFFLTNWRDLRAAIIGINDVRVLSFNSQSGTVIGNYGDSDVYISHIVVGMVRKNPPWNLRLLRIEKVVAPGEFLEHRWAPKDDAQSETESDVMGIPVRNVTDEVWEKVLSDAVQFNERCFSVEFYFEDDERLKTLQQVAGPTLRTFEAVGGVVYFSTNRRTPVSRSVPFTGVVRQLLLEDCRHEEILPPGG